ncbi:MAG: hypothetical protein IKD31_06425 [Clostridia bacterium]|nr:hypothetical protein [Clostridia bacterium]
MNGLKKHIAFFPPRIRKALEAYPDWGCISEIRLRGDMPLSLTHFRGNVFLNESGEQETPQNALRATKEEIRLFVLAFCRGNVYRYFDTFKDGFLVDEDGYRLGLSPGKKQRSFRLPEDFEGVNLRIPRMIRGAAKELLTHFSHQKLESTLLLSAPGAGKTTLLRDLAITLSVESAPWQAKRVCVIDEREELFPDAFRASAGLCDILSGYSKAEGIEIATRLFSPEVMILDEIGGQEDASAILSVCSSGCIFFASAHARTLQEAKQRPFLKLLLEAGVFCHLALLEKSDTADFHSRIYFSSAL